MVEGDHQSSILSEGIIIAEVLILAMLGTPMRYDCIISHLGIHPHCYDDEDFEKKKDRILFLIQLLIPDLKKGIATEKSYLILELLELILESWVRLLINVSTRCGRDSHAKQLGRGCELTTIVWILSHHASVFGI